MSLSGSSTSLFALDEIHLPTNTKRGKILGTRANGSTQRLGEDIWIPVDTSLCSIGGRNRRLSPRPRPRCRRLLATLPAHGVGCKHMPNPGGYRRNPSFAARTVLRENELHQN